MTLDSDTARRRKRRSEEELIQDLEAKIREVELRKARRQRRTESPIAKDFGRMRKHMTRFVESCLRNDRADIANSVLGFMTMLERQANEVRDSDRSDADLERDDAKLVARGSDA